MGIRNAVTIGLRMDVTVALTALDKMNFLKCTEK